MRMVWNYATFSMYFMRRLLIRRLLGGLACIALGYATLPARATMIAEDAFNYIPLGYSLDTANGGGGSPGWTTEWVNFDTYATVATGLTYSGYNAPNGLGWGSAATLGDLVNFATISRTIGDPGSVGEVWMRMLYSPGAQQEESGDTVTPFQLSTANNDHFLNLQRTVGAEGGALDRVFTLNMSGANVDSAAFDMSLGTHMVLFKLDINQTSGQNETLSMWLDPTALSAGDLGTANATIYADIMEGGDDYLALFSATGYGDRIDELVLATGLTGFDDVISQLNDPVTSVPEVSGPVMMLLATPLAVGAIWYRRRQSARA
jgi:hypothetical protein